jgi:hypothetical protein
MPDKKVPFVVMILLLTVPPGFFSLIPAPWIPASLQFPFFLRDAALSVLFGVIAAALLHSSYKKLPVVEAPRPAAPSRPGQRPQQPQVAGVSAKQAAAVVQSTMQRS